MRRATPRPLNSLTAALLVGSGVFVAIGAWRALHPVDAAPGTDWGGLRVAMRAMRGGADVSACDAVAEGAPRLDCLQYAASLGVQARDAAAVRAACAGMTDAPWRQSCLMDALGVDPALDVVSYVEACEEQVPLYAFHCETHARNRMEERQGEVPLAPEARPDKLVTVFPKLVFHHTDPENVLTARAFGKRLRSAGVAVDGCSSVDAALVAPCQQGFGE